MPSFQEQHDTIRAGNEQPNLLICEILKKDGTEIQVCVTKNTSTNPGLIARRLEKFVRTNHNIGGLIRWFPRSYGDPVMAMGLERVQCPIDSDCVHIVYCCDMVIGP